MCVMGGSAWAPASTAASVSARSPAIAATVGQAKKLVAGRRPAAPGTEARSLLRSMPKRCDVTPTCARGVSLLRSGRPKASAASAKMRGSSVAREPTMPAELSGLPPPEATALTILKRCPLRASSLEAMDASVGPMSTMCVGLCVAAADSIIAGKSMAMVSCCATTWRHGCHDFRPPILVTALNECTGNLGLVVLPGKPLLRRSPNNRNMAGTNWSECEGNGMGRARPSMPGHR
mmetsp:Transcript_34439/g.109368  ORF Transcript_34439/g.109368 Transcript_34439/m.109368 type:complete len:234 (-) Transcript_34439:624-1325(-)